MYSEEDINSAVASGALSAEAAERFRAHMSQLRAMPRGDEENFRLVTSFNDIFVSIGVVILLIAVGSIGGAITGAPNDASLFGSLFPVFLPSAMVAAAAWFLAEIFTRRRRMALPSILLLVAFVGGVLAASFALVSLPIGLISGIHTFTDRALGQSRVSDGMASVLVVLVMIGAAALTSYAAWQHWKRFMVPITVAAGAGAVVACAIGAAALVQQILTNGQGHFPMLSLVLVAGLGVFALAMRWDMSDRERTTRRSDVAFWLHLLAAPLIVHPLFHMLGLLHGSANAAQAMAAIAIYLGLGVVALLVDRRALLVSGLFYLFSALSAVLRATGMLGHGLATTALVAGAALLLLSAFWHKARAGVMALTPPGLRAMLSPV